MPSISLSIKELFMILLKITSGATLLYHKDIYSVEKYPIYIFYFS